MLRAEEATDDTLERSRRLAYENEERILSLLRSVRHENIVKLLMSYTVLRDPPEHNLLFSRADDSLKTVLQDKERDGLKVYFPSENILFQQLYGLSSAIEKLHDFTSDEYELHLIGCHYDLAPRNILVQHGRLLLADFGLSRLRPETSKSMFKAGNGDYLAPECEMPHNENFVKGVVGRASDIWSFGCILLEILVHTVQRRDKAQAIMDFRKQRRRNIFGEYITYLFHSFDKPSSATMHMLDFLDTQSTSVQRNHLAMIREMLIIDPNQRSTACDITTELFFRSQETIFTIIIGLLDDLKSRFDAFELVIERERLLLWGWGAKLLDNLVTLPYVGENHHRQWLKSSRESFDDVNKLLGLFLEELKFLEATLESRNHIARPIFVQLRQINDMLWALPPRPLRQRITSILENQLLGTDDRALLQKMNEVLWKGASTRNIAKLASIKFLTAKVRSKAQNTERPLLLPHDQLPTRVPIRKEFGVHDFGSMPCEEGTERLVLIERMSFDATESKHLEELYSRCEALSELLSQREMPQGFRILRCTGYFVDDSKDAIGMVYSMPQGFPMTLRPVTLNVLISRYHRPCLSKLFSLAYTLANCVLSVHKAGWLHKNISSHKVLFFDNELSRLIAIRGSEFHGTTTPPAAKDHCSSINSVEQAKKAEPSNRGLRYHLKKRLQRKNTGKEGSTVTDSASEAELPTASKGQACSDVEQYDSRTDLAEDLLDIGLAGTLQEPYLVGFDHSRMDTETAFTVGPSREPEQKPYQHPDHQKSNRSSRFRPEFDYYSLGVVLLELGLWRSVNDLVPAVMSDGGPSAPSKTALFRDLVPRLGSAMGALYRDATEACLNGSLASTDAAVRPFELFDQLVVHQIQQCHV